MPLEVTAKSLQEAWDDPVAEVSAIARPQSARDGFIGVNWSPGLMKPDDTAQQAKRCSVSGCAQEVDCASAAGNRCWPVPGVRSTCNAPIGMTGQGSLAARLAP